MKPVAPALSLVFVVALVVACKDREDVEVAASKYADTYCSKMFECNVPFDDPNETPETCKLKIENSLLKSADGARRTECSKDENNACRAAISGQECTTFVLDTFLSKKQPAACEGC